MEGWTTTLNLTPARIHLHWIDSLVVPDLLSGGRVRRKPDPSQEDPQGLRPLTKMRLPSQSHSATKGVGSQRRVPILGIIYSQYVLHCFSPCIPIECS